MKLVFINTDNLSISASGRLERWQFTLDYYLNSGIYRILFGNGPGYESAGGLEGGTTVNWYLNILIDYGLIGLLFIIFVFLGAFKNILKNNNKSIKFLLMLSLIFCAINLMTHTGFYFPFLWIILVLTNLNFNDKSEIKQK